MPAKNPRINITVADATAGLLAQLARQEHKSVSSFAKELLLEALERREDKVLSDLANIRDTKKAKRIRHKDAWK